MKHPRLTVLLCGLLVMTSAAFLLASPATWAGASADPDPAGNGVLREGVSDLAPAWPASFPVHGGGYGLIRELDAPLGLIDGLPRSPAVLELLREVFGPHLSDEQTGIALEGINAWGYRPIPPETRRRRPPTGHPSLTFQYISAEEAHTDNPGPRLVVQRTWFVVFDPARGVEPRGTALVMPGIFGTPEPTFTALAAALQKDGWTVLRMMAQPSRFTELMRWSIPLDDAAKRAEVMDEIAATVTSRVAECAYATRAAMKHLMEKRPELAGLPRVALGGSGGAMTLPSVLALEPEEYAAAVMIAGGADFFTMNIQSNYREMIGAVDVEWLPEGSGEPDEHRLAQLAGEYLSRSSLDSYHTARVLQGTPMLMIHATHDLAVPSHLGDLLWERLGRPERWSEPAGHEEVFMRLPGKFDDIVAWLREHTRKPEESMNR